MNAFNMTCEAVEATLPDYLDETLEAWVRTSVQEHLGECARCAGLVRDLRDIQREAAALPDLIPARDLWPRVERRIGTPVVSVAPAAPAPAAPSQTAPVVPSQTDAAYDARAYHRRFGPLRMGLAAAALVMVTASTTYLLTVASLKPAEAPNVATAVSPASADQSRVEARISEAPREPGPMETRSSDAGLPGSPSPSPSPLPLPSPSPPPSPSSAMASLASQASPSPADPVYEQEVARLQTIMSWRKAQLNPSTAAILEHNLRIIDAAIAQSKEAVRNDPAQPMLRDLLTRALDKKVGLLRRAAMLSPRT